MSRPKFCTSCGSPIDPGQKFCTSCGASIDFDSDGSSDKVSPQLHADSGIDVFSNGETVQMPRSYSPGPSNTSPMPSVQDSTVRQYRQAAADSMPAAQSAGTGNRKILIVIIAVLAVILCVLLGVLLGNVFGGTGQQDSSGSGASSSHVQQSDPSSNGTSSSAQNGYSDSEQEIYNQLNSYYSKLGNYDTQIASCASTFNSNYLKRDMSTRQAYAKEAESLLSQVKSDYSSLQSLSVSSSSSNSSSYNSMVTCYNDCVQRISVICDAWTNSLGYSDPTGHDDAICAPLSRDKVNGSNKYYTDFQQNYSKAKPVAPSN